MKIKFLRRNFLNVSANSIYYFSSDKQLSKKLEDIHNPPRFLLSIYILIDASLIRYLGYGR